MPNLVKKYCKVCDKITPHYPGGDPLEMHCTRSHVAILKESTPSTEQESYIVMRTDCDCMVACLAMLMGWGYEQAADFFPPRAITKTGYTWDLLVPFLRANKIRLIWYGPEIINTVDWSRPAMVDVPSLTAPDKGDHIIFWDGQKVIDPTRKDTKYTALPDEIFNVYQLKPMKERSEPSKEETKTDNEIIAEFMGHSIEFLKSINENWINGLTVRSSELQYHTSWDHLMPVVEKIRTLRNKLGDKENGLAYSTISIGIDADGHKHSRQEGAYRVSLLGSLTYRRMINEYQHTYDHVEVPHITKYGIEGIKVLYDVIVEFIKWYNTQQHERK